MLFLADAGPSATPLQFYDSRRMRILLLRFLFSTAQTVFWGLIYSPSFLLVHAVFVYIQIRSYSQQSPALTVSDLC